VELPLLRQNLLEMLLDTEAATTVVLNAAAVFDGWDAGGAEDRKLFRLLTPLAKYWTTMRARWVASEAMNVRGGNGYIEDWPNARLVRDSYLGAIWEGTSNVVALDRCRSRPRSESGRGAGGRARRRSARTRSGSAARRPPPPARM